MANKNVTNVDIRDRMDSMRLEIKSDISQAIATVSQNQGRLEKKFDDLEAGRLTRNEAAVRDLTLAFEVYKNQSMNQEKVLSNKFVALGAVGIVILTAISSAFFLWLFKVGH